jgi:hypothetical protein
MYSSSSWHTNQKGTLKVPVAGALAGAGFLRLVSATTDTINVIVDTGSSFMITDLRSANGVLVPGRRLHPSATLADGDHIRICGYEFTFELQR